MLNNKQLKKEVFRLKKVCKNDVIPEGELIVFRGHQVCGGYIRQYGFLCKNFNGSGVIDPLVLHKILVNLPNDGFTRIKGIENRVKVITQHGTFEFDNYDLETFPKPRIEDEFDYILSGFSDIEKLKTAKKFVSEDDLRPAMEHIYLDREMIAATNAHYLYFSKVDYELDKDQALLIDPMVVDMFADDFKFDIGISKNHLIYTNKNRFFSHHICDAKYPNVRAVIPDEFDKKLIVSKSELERKVKMSAIVNPTFKAAQLNLNGKSDITSLNENEGNFLSELEDSIYSGEKFSVVFNSRLMLGALSFCGKRVEIAFQHPNKAFVIDGEYLLMPQIVGA